MQEARVDVVLMDNQRAPAILASPEHVQIDQVMADVAVATGAGLFARGALMDQWRAPATPTSASFRTTACTTTTSGYRCVASALTAAIVDGLTQTLPTRTAAKR